MCKTPDYAVQVYKFALHAAMACAIANCSSKCTCTLSLEGRFPNEDRPTENAGAM